MSQISIQRLTKNDLPAVKDIYNHYIKTTHISFETNPYDDAYMGSWFTQFADTGRHQAFVAIENSQLLGFILSQKFKEKPAYSTSVETTIYLTEAAAGKGLGKQLGQYLLKILKTQDVKRAYAIIALPNAASIGLHKNLGFMQAGHFTDVGRKFNNFHDVVYLEYKF